MMVMIIMIAVVNMMRDSLVVMIDFRVLLVRVLTSWTLIAMVSFASSELFVIMRHQGTYRMVVWRLLSPVQLLLLLLL
jgi:hypothetical protein